VPQGKPSCGVNGDGPKFLSEIDLLILKRMKEALSGVRDYASTLAQRAPTDDMINR
jgi:hypothetical protein